LDSSIDSVDPADLSDSTFGSKADKSNSKELIASLGTIIGLSKLDDKVGAEWLVSNCFVLLETCSILVLLVAWLLTLLE
jgi:hypothetical protein